MTGFGRSETINVERKIIVEIKAVNHRYCDMNIKVPKRYNHFEADIYLFIYTFCYCFLNYFI